ncbi:MAG: serine hydrolase [Patescibacteria group bacterium]
MKNQPKSIVDSIRILILTILLCIFGSFLGPNAFAQSYARFKPRLPEVSNSSSLQLQSLMSTSRGGMVIVDERGNVVSQFNKDLMLEPASTAKLLTALAFLKKYKSNQRIAQFHNQRSIDVLAYMLRTSDNGLADKLANIVGLDNVQRIARDVTGNNSIYVANGSGCPRGLNGPYCEGYSYRQTTKLSPLDLIKVIQSLEQELALDGYNIAYLLGSVKTPGSSGNKRFGIDFAKYRNVPLYGKTGTIRSSLSFAGVMYNQYGQKLTFAFINIGPHSEVGDFQAKLLVKMYQSGF